MRIPTTRKGIIGWPENERPRERLFKQGAPALSDAELVAVLLRTGLRGKDAVVLARELLVQFGGLRGLLSRGTGELFRIRGLGKAKIAALLAASEMSRRELREEMASKDFVRDPQSVLDYLYRSLRDRKREIFKVLFLNKANRILGERDLFEGTVDETAVHPREVVKAALEFHATAIILVHNHPSGKTEPSPQDMNLTRKLQSACLTLSVTVLDHLIIGDNQYYSFREHGLIS